MYKGNAFLIRRPSKNFHIVYYVNGKRLTKSTGTKNKNEAAKILKSFQDGFTVSEINMSSLLEKYITVGNPSMADGTKYIYRSAIKSFFKFLPDRNIKHYSVLDFETYLTNFYFAGSGAPKRSPYTVSIHFRVLNSLYNAAVKWGFIAQNPLSKVKKIPKPESDPKFLTKQHFKALIDAIDNYSPNGIENKYKVSDWKQFYKDLFNFAVLSGLRFNEIQHLRPEHIDISNKLIRVISSSAHRTKDKDSRLVELHPQLIPVYERRKHNKYLFTSIHNLLLNADRVTKQLKKFHKAAGNPPEFCFQTFRSTFGMWLIQAGQPIEYISAQLGHSSIETTTRFYAKWIVSHNTGRINSISVE